MTLDAPMREALALVESQRDDAVAYLGTVRSLLGVLRPGGGLRGCAREVARILARELKAESCAVVRFEAERRPSVLGFATQAEQLGAPDEDLPVDAWIALADRIDPRAGVVWLRPSANGGFGALDAADVGEESFQVVPFTIGDEPGGVVLLHRLVEPAQTFAAASATLLIASVVGEVLTIVHSRDAAAEIADKLEAELGVARSSLRTRDATLLERERTIARLTDAVLESSRVKRDFLSVISHELRTPLNAIVGFASLLREDLAASATEDHAEMMDALLDRAEHLTGIVDDVLLYVDLEAGEPRAAQQSADLRTLIDEVVARVARDQGAAIDLAITIDPEAARPWLDAPLLRRVLFHLVDNAYKFTAEGRVSVSVRSGCDPRSVELEVSDTGQGMPPERVQEMFELFRQGDGSVRRSHDGLGLGLALVQRAASALGGHVAVQSRPGEGSTVRVVLPDVLDARRALVG